MLSLPVVCTQFQAQELTFNGHQFQEFVVERSAAYISQVQCGVGTSWAVMRIN